MRRLATRRQDSAALDRDLGRLFRSVEVRVVPDRLKTLLDQLEAGPAEALKKAS